MAFHRVYQPWHSSRPLHQATSGKQGHFPDKQITHEPITLNNTYVLQTLHSGPLSSKALFVCDCVLYVRPSDFKKSLFKVINVTGALIMPHSRPLLQASYEVILLPSSKGLGTAKIISHVGDQTRDHQVVSRLP